jgi:hypothetical protein
LQEQVVERAGFIDRMASISSIAALDGSDRDAAVAHLLAVPDDAAVFGSDGSLTLPYRAKAHWAARTQSEED